MGLAEKSFITTGVDVNVKKLSIDSKYDSVSLTNRFTLAKNKIRNIYGDFELADGNLILKANDNGIVSYVFDGDKEVVAGSILMKVINNKTTFYALVKRPPSLIGKIRKNKQAVLKVASFPFYEWGTVKGHVDNLSLTPDESGNFSVKISLQNFGNLNNLLQIGMTGDATIILEEKTFYYYFFRKTKEIYYKATMRY
jgi:hypothetical protein